MGMQILCTPLHLTALGIINATNLNTAASSLSTGGGTRQQQAQLAGRVVAKVWSVYPQVVLVRMARMLPAYVRRSNEFGKKEQT